MRSRTPQRDPRRDRPHPREAGREHRGRARDRVLPADDGWLSSLTVRLQREDFDIAAEIAALTRGRTDIGAVVTFTGLCRDNDSGKGVAALTLEHYPGMAEEEIARHVAEAREALAAARRHGDPSLRPSRAGREHRAGRQPLSAHRGPAFAAAEFLMDYLKTRAPFWKKEEQPGGAQWVAAKDSDDAAAGRWTVPPKQAAE